MPPSPRFSKAPIHGAPNKTEVSRHKHGSTFRFHIEVGNRRVLDVEAFRIA